MVHPGTITQFSLAGHKALKCDSISPEVGAQ